MGRNVLIHGVRRPTPGYVHGVYYYTGWGVQCSARRPTLLLALGARTWGEGCSAPARLQRVAVSGCRMLQCLAAEGCSVRRI